MLGVTMPPVTPAPKGTGAGVSLGSPPIILAKVMSFKLTARFCLKNINKTRAKGRDRGKASYLPTSGLHTHQRAHTGKHTCTRTHTCVIIPTQ